MKKIRIMLDQEDGTTVTLGSVEAEGQSALYRCHPAFCTTNPYGNRYWTPWADGPCIS